MTDTEEYKFDVEMGMKMCQHVNAYIDPACCSGRDSEGNPSCACHGQDAVACPNPKCTDIQDWEVEGLFERLQGYDEDY
jgi:hypothetical protein